ncbi:MULTISPECIES: catalase [unclassified Methylophilus]|uniref:catalase n=1 Tax=unclassified Methylophilus TaxID=2630143 RepID=UPI0007000C0F|nr:MULTISPECIES: catalase [unclassified Methylophilus]KQT43647.1 catalase [Methylophilus sp. Leaf416]KQT59132.1 catalase [Methylophilus sp. Leaf459]
MAKAPKTQIGLGSVLSTVSGPSTHEPPDSALDNSVPTKLVDKFVGSDELSTSFPHNATKSSEYGEASRCPFSGTISEAPDAIVGASTVSELNTNEKTGEGPPDGENLQKGDLDRVRSDSAGQTLTTNQGVAVGDNQSSLKIGLRGPTAMEDFILREKLTHFDHERIPERVVHARGSAAHGYFENYQPLSKYTKATPFNEAGKQTPVFVRFSTVAGERGSSDTARDVRGFAVKFYTDSGNWDLVGNNIPVFFIQDAMKFPDLVHAVKPEPHHAMPQASSAHDTYWDFVSLMPESTHMLLWQMSDRAIPRSYRTMQGFGVHTFRLINENNESVFCKFHWTPVAGTHSLAWDEAVKISGADPDFHRRDLWEAIEAGAYPEWELGLQIFTEAEADKFDFDVLDATKLIPVELVPLVAVGKLVLNRNPDNFFAETEQVAFCTAHIIPGIDFTNDPLLQGRIHSYLDTQISRLGGVNFHEIPINAPLEEIHNNQRDGMHRQNIPRGRVAYEPNSLGGGCPFQAGMQGFTSFPEPVAEDKVRGKPEKFADHYSQATLFWISQSEIEKQHIINAFRFELTRIQVPAIRERVVSLLVNVDETLAQEVADGLGIDLPAAAPLASDISFPVLDASPALSETFYPGDGTIKTKRVAILAAHGVNGANVNALYDAILAQGGVPRILSTKLGKLETSEGKTIHVEATLETMPGVLFDGMVIAEGEQSVANLALNAHTCEFLQNQYRHCKPILVPNTARSLLQKAGIEEVLSDGNPDPSLFIADDDAYDNIEAFITALGKPRDHSRETDPPLV